MTKATRAGMVQAIRDTAGLSINQAQTAVDTLITWLAETIAEGNTVELRGLGVFEVKAVPKRNIPAAFGGFKVAPAHGKVVFRPGKALKEAVKTVKAEVGQS
jgi:nucleoid DNA-binding protein